MTIWLYCICRDESRLMPYFLRHYAPWVDRLIFYDDQSMDGTRDMIRYCPNAVLRDWPGEHGIVDDQFLEFANEQWKEARGHADWVIWVDADEFLYHPDIRGVLERYRVEGVDLPQIQGYLMISDHFPTTSGQIYEEIKTGLPDSIWSKQAIFRGAMKWNMGRHSYDYAALKLKISALLELKLLHYRCLGIEYLKERHARNWARVPERCRRMNLGTNCAPDHEGHHGVKWFEEISIKQFENVI